jgi:NDP-sugar pyrophosphorylase family protein
LAAVLVFRSGDMMMQAVILAGGKGTRIQSISTERPKSLLEVAGKPFIEHQLQLLSSQGFSDIVLCVGHLGDQIEAHVGNGSKFGVSVSYVRENPEDLLGTGGAVVNALRVLSSAFIVIYGDSYLATDYRAVVDDFLARGSEAMMCVYRNEGRWDWSNAVVERGKVVFFSKRAAPDKVQWIDYGLSIYRRSVFERYAGSRMPLDMACVQESLVKDGRLDAYEVQQRFFEIGKPEGLAELDSFLRGRGR